MPANQGLTPANWKPKPDFQQPEPLKSASPREVRFFSLAGLTEFIEFDANLPEVESYPQALRHELALGIAQTLIKPEHLVSEKGTNAAVVVEEYIALQTQPASPLTLPGAGSPQYADIWSPSIAEPELPVKTVFVVSSQPLELAS